MAKRDKTEDVAARSASPDPVRKGGKATAIRLSPAIPQAPEPKLAAAVGKTPRPAAKAETRTAETREAKSPPDRIESPPAPRVAKTVVKTLPPRPLNAVEPPGPKATTAVTNGTELPAAALEMPPAPVVDKAVREILPPPPPPKTAEPPKASAPVRPAPEPSQTPLPNFEQLSRNVARYIEEGGKVLAAFMKPREAGEAKASGGDELSDMLTTLGRVAEYYASDGHRAFKAQAELSGQFLNLWSSTLMRLQGEATPPVAPPASGDKRFADPDWQANPYFDFLKQAYMLTTNWADDLVRRADEIDPHTRDKAAFYLKQVTSALSPSNFLATNPELLKTTLAESGENLVRGLHMMAEDIEAGHGQLRIRQVDAAKFKLGVNLATTPGKVIFRNELIELIQYAPSTPDVYKRPLLIVPPWINKFYVLDLNPEKSFIRWAVAQGLTVFVISWVNPDERHADKGFEAYMREGIFAALEIVEQSTGEKEVTAIGYCVGGTLLAVTLAFMAAIGDKRIVSATFFTTQVDFADAGDLKIFVDAEQLKSIETKMTETGYLDGAHMANAFNMLRPNDLIWSYWINNYLKGKEPMAFDLLVWNADSTRMPAANHRFYLRHCYLQNDLTNDRLVIEGRPISLKNVTIPIYNLAAKEDHIAPARSVFNGAKYFGGPMRYVMSGSGHIAGVVNPPMKPKYQYWTGDQPHGAFADWVAAAKQTPGSWWLDWIQWVSAQAPEKVPAREPGGGKIEPLCDAPGEYVRVKA